MDPRVFLLICLAAASRHQPSSVLEVEANDPQDHAFNETDFQRLRDAVNSGDHDRMYRIARAPMWPSFVKAHPEEGLDLFKKLAKDKKANIRWGAAESPAWPMVLETHNAEAWPLFEKLAKDENVNVTQRAAYSPAWPMLLETHNAAAWRLFEKLAQDEDVLVRVGAAMSPAWPTLLETHNAEAWPLFEKLVQDEVAWVRWGAANSPAWPDLIQSSLSQSWQLFAELMSDQELRYRYWERPSWKAFGKVPPTAVAEDRDSQNLQTARSLQKMADSGLSHEVQGLPLFDGFFIQLRRSTNETWLGEMIKLPLFVGNAAQRSSPAENV